MAKVKPPKVRLHTCYVWTCKACKHPQLARRKRIRVEAVPEERRLQLFKEFGILDDWQTLEHLPPEYQSDMVFRGYPAVVACEKCGERYRTVVD